MYICVGSLVQRPEKPALPESEQSKEIHPVYAILYHQRQHHPPPNTAQHQHRHHFHSIECMRRLCGENTLTPTLAHTQRTKSSRNERRFWSAPRQRRRGDASKPPRQPSPSPMPTPSPTLAALSALSLSACVRMCETVGNRQATRRFGCFVRIVRVISLAPKISNRATVFPYATRTLLCCSLRECLRVCVCVFFCTCVRCTHPKYTEYTESVAEWSSRPAVLNREPHTPAQIHLHVVLPRTSTH